MKTCAHCGTQFAPARPLATVCSPICASRLVRQRAKEKTAQKALERKSVKQRKENIKTIHDLIKEAQTAFNAYIRARDHGLPCICCGAAYQDSSVGGAFDCGHYRSTGSAPHLRFTEDNASGQSKHCNRWGAGRAVDYRIGLINRIGIERVEALENNNQVHKWTKEELRDIKSRYVAKLKELKRAKENVSPDQ